CCSTNPGHVLYSNEYIGTRPYIFDPANREGGFLLEKDGEVIGTVFSTIEKTLVGGKETTVGGIYALGILPQYRKKGLAHFLLVKSMEWLESKNVEKMYLYLDAQNPSALRLYQRAGFVIAKEEIKYRLRFGP
ncbi:MAG: GNAT family N-acetyltransferase, partial [Candidatus Thermoplasmatota archaeon]|nr:GNAT family N-acetyltransferase [Candidatus Thermoplasmatota archaeon]